MPALHRRSAAAAHDLGARPGDGRGAAPRAAGERVLHLERGEPDFDTPAAHRSRRWPRAARAGETHYPDARGSLAAARRAGREAARARTASAASPTTSSSPRRHARRCSSPSRRCSAPATSCWCCRRTGWRSRSWSASSTARSYARCRPTSSCSRAAGPRRRSRRGCAAALAPATRGDLPQHAQQPDRRRAVPRASSGGDRRGRDRARPVGGERRGLRAPAVRRRPARQHGVAARHGRAHASASTRSPSPTR